MNKHQPIFVKDKRDKRLKALKLYNVLDTLPENEFDAIARLASHICNTPIALISFIDADRQWVKSRVGIEAKQMPRADAFCNHTILGNKIFEVPDVLESKAFRINTFVINDPQIRFYAGAPLIDPNGYRLGALCVMDMIPRKLDKEQLNALRTLADDVMTRLELRKQKKELEENQLRQNDFLNLFSNSPEIQCIMDRDFRIEIINRSVTDILGYTPDEASGHSLWNFFSEGVRTSALQKLKRNIDHKKSVVIETPVLTLSGDIKWINWSLVFKESKWYASGRDISYQKKAKSDLDILSFAARKSPSGMVIRDNEGKIIWMNEALEKLLGYPLEEVKGMTVGSMIIGDETDMDVFNSAVLAFQENRPYEVELRVYRKDRTPIWVFLSNSPLFNESGDVERQVGMMVDISGRKKAEEQLTLLSLVASSTTSGVIINDKNGKVEWVNKAFEQITGYTLKNAEGRPLGDVLKGELTDISVINKSRELSKNKQSFEVDLLVYRKDGQPLWISVINSVILDTAGRVDKYIEVIIDITSKKKAEIELIAAKEEALQLSRAKDMFISVMSHEIRTPLNAVIGISHLMLDDNPVEIQKENLSILRFSAENLMTLINNVLDFTKIETGNIELEKTEVELNELVQSITNSMQFNAGEKKIYLKCSIDETIPEVVIGDSARLCQVLLNLVGNAVKFTETGGVTIDLKVVEQTNKDVKIRFAVTDTGIGIANDKINTIFESFKQAEADTSRKYGGTGLGLAITKRLIELHDAKINVDSVPGVGSTFWFTIKFDKGHIHAINNNKVETGLQLNVLVVDDNQINRLLINKVLGKWGATIDFAENGLEAVNKIENNPNFDVVLMDIHMPVMGGLEATQIIRAKSEAYYQELPIIALTASMLNSEVNEIARSGMNDYILKPFDPKGLYDKLSKYQKVG
ncbi:MAG TPA: PAS domain S-box protein [Mucilaginibacter sp.]|nr:PAS domain S-box protein [Mucilaginibacter sp.]